MSLIPNIHVTNAEKRLEKQTVNTYTSEAQYAKKGTRNK